MKPLTYGTWFYNGDTVSGSFDPASDPTGIYSYTIPGTANCPSDTAYVILDVFSASNISITSQSTICSNETGFTLQVYLLLDGLLRAKECSLIAQEQL